MSNMHQFDTIGETIRFIRFSGRLSQTEFAKMMDCSQGTIAGYENGTSDPSYKFLKRLKGFIEQHNINVVLL